jgi:hypothetical protein
MNIRSPMRASPPTPSRTMRRSRAAGRGRRAREAGKAPPSDDDRRRARDQSVPARRRLGEEFAQLRRPKIVIAENGRLRRCVMSCPSLACRRPLSCPARRLRGSADGSRSQRARPGARLAQLLAGKVAGPPVSCLPNYRSNDMEVIDTTRSSSATAAPGLRQEHQRRMLSQRQQRRLHAGDQDRSAAQAMCRGDIANVVDANTGMPREAARSATSSPTTP